MKLKIRSRLRPAKPVFKGVIMVFIGIYITRQFVGIGRYSSNLLFGLIAYIFIAVSGLICVRIMQFNQNSSSNRKITEKQLLLIMVSIYAIGFIITLLDILFYYLDIL